MKLNINSNKFLNKEIDIKHKDVVVLQSEGQWEESKIFKKEDGTPNNQFVISMKIPSGETRNTTIGFSNVKLLIAGFGDETKDWVGKRVKAWKTKSEKAKLGYTYTYVPESWERDDTGEWIMNESNTVHADDPLADLDKIEKEGTMTSIGINGEEIDVNDIPF